MTLQSVIEHLREWPPWLVYALLFGASFIEYIVPPVPGDTLVVAGCVLVAAFDWSPLGVFAVITAGAILGAWCDFRVGKWLVKSGKLERMGDTSQRAIANIAERMRKHGAIYLAVNRFIPALRAFFFIAAGVAGLSTRSVLLWSTVSAMAWNALLIAIGYSLGKNVAAIEDLLANYAVVVWSILGAIVLVLLVRWIVRRRRRPRVPRT